ncbi:type VI secretion protein, family [Roseibium sp. TrichSKD4]|uniref:type VI secretion system baseplate subunit TssK n=1 Tax=Roseibium sp. TrichSKD4 TaxID=744980 RepID=UPI0001E56E49|nr:type VI secretion system baseplate subunit TssK [Roseibium sp. TrichSKD4]EFO30315.1 type VI secretion protein, family [Roseibium sp. TrichSKD4]
MSLRNHVVWRDGLFLKPHHFQQQQRYMEYLVKTRADTLDPYQTGLSRIEINLENLLHGKVLVDYAQGVFPDGSILDIPGETSPPEALDVSTRSIVDQRIYIALPLRLNGVPEVEDAIQPQDNTRMRAVDQEVRDNASVDTEPFMVSVAQYRVRLMLEEEDRSSYTCLPIARIREKRSDGSLVLDDEFLPTAANIEALPTLKKVLDDFVGLLQQRARQISARLGSPGQRGVSDVSDFLMLQTVNRLWPEFRHLSTITGVHPKDLFMTFAKAAGELATFSHDQRMPPAWPAYHHEEPRVCFDPVIASLRQALTAIFEANAIALPLQKQKFGIYTSPIADRSLMQNAIFVIAIKASVQLEKLAKDFPAQTKVSSIEKIRELIQLHLPGVVLQRLPSPPRQLPYHAGFTYFQLDQNSAGWGHMDNASGFAFHVAGTFPDLDMQFWAIRNERAS